MSGLDQAGIYWPGTSLLHRCPAGVKLGVLTFGSLALVVWRGFLALGIAAVVVALGYGLARIPVPVARAQLLVLVAAAALVTLTTRVSALIDTFVWLARPLRPLGFDPERLGLMAALTLRTVPVIARIRDEAAEARRARGLERSPRALLVPLVVRTVRHADHLGEALAARGVDD
jgi:biotin transport system permease protein